MHIWVPRNDGILFSTSGTTSVSRRSLLHEVSTITYIKKRSVFVELQQQGFMKAPSCQQLIANLATELTHYRVAHTKHSAYTFLGESLYVAFTISDSRRVSEAENRIITTCSKNRRIK